MPDEQDQVSSPRKNIKHGGDALWLLALLCMPAFAQDPPMPTPGELAGLLEAARRYELRDNAGERLVLREPPVLNFTNPQRNQELGSVFVWLRKDRPAAIGQFFWFNTTAGRLSKHAFHSLLSEPLQARQADTVVWSPDKPGVQWQPLRDAPAAKSDRIGRHLQMRQLARRFKVTLFDAKETPTELRLAPRPLLEYETKESGVVVGQILSYVIATDPEAILLMECVEESGRTDFRYAFARFHFWKLTASDGDQLVWQVPFDPSMSGNRVGNPDTIHKVYNSFHP